MFFSPPRLHPPLITTDRERDFVRRQIDTLIAGEPRGTARRGAALAPFSIALTTVSKAPNFDSYIDVQFPNPNGAPVTARLLADSGNSNMIIPNGEDLVGVPGYTILGTAQEPWGCPANVVQGTLQIVATDGGVYAIENCVFYACTGVNSYGERTANFGMAKIHPWCSSTPWNTPLPGVILQSPLSYGTDYPYAEIIFEPATAMFSSTADVLVRRRSRLVMHATLPSGYTMLSTHPKCAWMTVVPTSFAIGNTTTGWPGRVWPLIAMIDTGGGPVLLSDPDGFVWPKAWPNTVACPTWCSTSVDCNCIFDPLQISLKAAHGDTPYCYAIKPLDVPPAEWGITAVMCRKNFYLEGRQGMNVGGITFLFNRLLIDYAGARIGLAPMAP